MKILRYLVIQKGNGRFYPRIKSNIYEGWPNKLPSDGYATLEEAKAELIKAKTEQEERARLNSEIEVFEL